MATAVAVLIGAALLLVVAVRVYLERPTAEARLLSRARAERRIAAELDPLAVSGWVLFHDRVLVGGEHRLAHIAVGPAGVFVIEPLPRRLRRADDSTRVGWPSGCSRANAPRSDRAGCRTVAITIDRTSGALARRVARARWMAHELRRLGHPEQAERFAALADPQPETR